MKIQDIFPYMDAHKRVIHKPLQDFQTGSATTKMDTAERSISIGRESLQVCLGNRHHGVLAGFTTRGQ
jgi:hypothetical protein